MHLRRSLCALLCLAILPAWAQYDKRELKPWFSLDVAARHQNVDWINTLLFEDVGAELSDGVGGWDTTVAPYYKKFDAFPTAPPNLNFGLGAGVEYDRFLMGFHTGFSLPRTSQKPTDPNSPDGVSSAVVFTDSAGVTDSLWIKFHDASYYLVDLEISFGWMWLPAPSKLNFITTLRAGFSLLNVKYPGEYSIFYGNGEEALEPYIISDTWYTSSGRTIGPEIELRYSPTSSWRISGIAGYRYMTFDQIPLESDITQAYYVKHNTDMDASSAYFGARLTLVLRSDKEKAQDFNE